MKGYPKFKKGTTSFRGIRTAPTETPKYSMRYGFKKPDKKNYEGLVSPNNDLLLVLVFQQFFSTKLKTKFIENKPMFIIYFLDFPDWMD